MDINAIITTVKAGERLALARLLTQVENDSFEGRAALDALFSHAGRAHLVGVTGSPGTGKSSLVNQLAKSFRHPADGQPEATVAIVAVDPSSPFTGGAILGDRVRMRDLSGDPGIFIRSMASRGALGGLARSTAAVTQVLDAAGFDIILIETVGAGQSEVDIARLAHTTVVVEAPGMGDDIQAIKAGILEVADILVINKADQPGVEATERALKTNLELAHPEKMEFCSAFGLSLGTFEPKAMWLPPVLRTIAPEGSGVDAVAAAIRQHGNYLRETGEWRLREAARLDSELYHLLQATLMFHWQETIAQGEFEVVFQQLLARQISPQQAVTRLLEGMVTPWQQHG